MCIVSRRNNYIFFHIPKCGGTSISEILPNKEKVRLIEHTHLTYQEVKSVFEQNNEMYFFNNAHKFAIVRNPKERVISLFKYIKRHSDHHLHNRIMNYDFTQFCYFLKNVGDDSIKSCSKHLSDENGLIDISVKIIKLESINSKINTISNFIGEDLKEIPHINKSDFFYEMTKESDLLIRETFSDDYELIYK